MSNRDNLTPEQRFVFDYVDRNAKAIALTGDNIFYFGELGMQEFETAGLMTDLLEKGGFKVERGIAGFPTGFCATYGSGDPVIAIHTEYDSCPDNSQVSGVAEQEFIVEGAPGHCEGHNVNAAVLVGDRARDEAGDGEVRPEGHAEGVRCAGRGAARQPALFRARRLVRRRRPRVPQPHRRRVQRHPWRAAIGADLGDLHLPRRDRAFRRRALEGSRRARRRGADGCRHGAIPRAHAAGDARASRHHQRRRSAQRDPAHGGGVVVLPRPDRGRRDEAVRAGEEDRAGRGADEQHRGDGRRAQRGVAAALQPHARRAAPAPHRDRSACRNGARRRTRWRARCKPRPR